MQVGLGIGLEHDDRSNVVVREIIPGYGAFAAGTIVPGDILLAVDGRSQGLSFRVMIVLFFLAPFWRQREIYLPPQIEGTSKKGGFWGLGLGIEFSMPAVHWELRGAMTPGA